MNYIDYIETLSKKEYIGQKPGLNRIRKILKLLDNPQEKYPVIHITGTNGKGSTALMIYSILIEAGYKVGLYTSPHIVDFRERIRINDKLITLSEINKIMRTIFKYPITNELTYFELMTSLAFKYFESEKVDFVVSEVGLGGKYDATNIVNRPVVSIITSIDYDHIDYFGNKLESIAYEKSGIIKPKVPVIINTNYKKINDIIKNVCNKKKSSMYSLGKDFYYKYFKTDWERKRQLFSYFGLYTEYKNLWLSLLGRHQLDNASLALACIEILNKNYSIIIKEKNIYDSLKTVYWQGRFEIFDYKKNNHKLTVILDGAHNPAGAKVLKRTILESPYIKKGITFVMSILKDKDYKNICKILSPIAKKIIIFKSDSPRALNQNILKKIWEKYLPYDKIFVVDNFNQFLQKLDTNDKVVCITGSLYGIGMAIKYLKSITKYRGRING